MNYGDYMPIITAVDELGEVAESDAWELQAVTVPLKQVAYWERVVERCNQWAAQNLELQREVERLRSERGVE